MHAATLEAAYILHTLCIYCCSTGHLVNEDLDRRAFCEAGSFADILLSYSAMLKHKGADTLDWSRVHDFVEFLLNQATQFLVACHGKDVPLWLDQLAKTIFCCFCKGLLAPPGSSGATHLYSLFVPTICHC